MRTKNLTNVLRISLLVATVLSVGLATAGASYAQVSSVLVRRAEQITGDRFSVATTTPRGVNVIARVTPRPETLNAIDRGFEDLFAVAHRHGYRNRTNFREYTVFIGRADRTRDSSGQYSPDIAVPSQQYAGSVYDQGGFVFAAGLVLAYNPSAFVIAEHERDMTRISNVVRFEGEHIVLYYNNRALYTRTADHSRGGGHPILQ